MMSRTLAKGLSHILVFCVVVCLLTGCGVYKEWKQKEQARMIQTTREVILRENAERKAEKEALDRSEYCEHWGVYNRSSRYGGVYDIQVA